MRKQNKGKRAAQKIGAAFFMCGFIGLIGCAGKWDLEAESKNYHLAGTMYTDGRILTTDGNIWVYETETLDYMSFNIKNDITYSKVEPEKVFDGMPVYICINDKGTDEKADDEIVRVGYDFLGEVKKTTREAESALVKIKY